MSLAILEQIIERAKNLGIDACDVIMNEGESLSLSSFEGKLDKFKVSGSKIVGIRAIKDDKVGISYSESLDSDALDFMVKSALENSSFASLNIHEKIQKTQTSNALKDESVQEEISMQEKIDLAIRLETEVLQRESLAKSVPYTGYSEAKSSKFYMNSLGSSFIEKSSNYSCYTSALLKEGDFSSTHHEGALSKRFHELDWNKCVETSLLHAKAWLSAKSLPSGKYDVIFDIGPLSSLFSAFQEIFSGKRASENNNPFQEKLGKSIASTSLTMIDSPQFKEAMFPSFFDDEGFEQEDVTLIKDGVFCEFLHNSFSGAKLSQKNNCRGARGAKSALGVTSTNIVIKANAQNDSSLLKGKYLEIHALQGLHSGTNFYSGEFSFAASGYLCADGQRIMPIKGITIAGNFYKMLNSIVSMGSVLEATESKSFFAPVMRFSDLYIAGE